MPLAFAAILFGAILLVSGAKGQSLLDTALGRTGHLAGSSPSDVADPIAGNPVTLGASPAVPVGGALSTLVSECSRIAALQLPYRWGGGHAGYPPDGPFDCSGAVSYVLHAAGLLQGPPLTSGLLMLWGSPGPGKHLTVWANLGHVFLEIDGIMWGTSHQNPGGGPGWHHRPTTGFTARHYPGL